MRTPGARHQHKCHGLNIQVIADPAGRLIWISPVLPGARHDMGAAREHGIVDALNQAGVQMPADTAYQGGGPAIRVPSAARASTPTPAATGASPVSRKRSTPPTPAAADRASEPNSEIKNWRILRKIRSSPSRANTLAKAVQALTLAG